MLLWNKERAKNAGWCPQKVALYSSSMSNKYYLKLRKLNFSIHQLAHFSWSCLISLHPIKLIQKLLFMRKHIARFIYAFFRIAVLLNAFLKYYPLLLRPVNEFSNHWHWLKRDHLEIWNTFFKIIAQQHKKNILLQGTLIVFLLFFRLKSMIIIKKDKSCQ